MKGLLYKDISLDELKEGDTVLFIGGSVFTYSHYPPYDKRPRGYHLDLGVYQIVRKSKYIGKIDKVQFPVCIGDNTNCIGWVSLRSIIPLIKADED